MNNRKALGITFAILGIICVIFAAIHAINDPISASFKLLLAYGALGILFFITGKTLLRNRQDDNTLQSYR